MPCRSWLWQRCLPDGENSRSLEVPAGGNAGAHQPRGWESVHADAWNDQEVRAVGNVCLEPDHRSCAVDDALDSRGWQEEGWECDTNWRDGFRAGREGEAGQGVARKGVPSQASVFHLRVSAVKDDAAEVGEGDVVADLLPDRGRRTHGGDAPA